MLTSCSRGGEWNPVPLNTLATTLPCEGDSCYGHYCERSVEVLTDESEDALGEGQGPRVEQQTEAVGPVLQGQHVDHGQEEPGLGDRA